MTVSEYAIKNPITATMVALSVVVLGAISLFRLPLEYAPNLSWPSMFVSVSYPSSSPEEIERAITRPIEEVLSTLPGVKTISSRSYSNRGWVRIEFDFGTDMNLVSIQVRDRLDQVRRFLPDDVERIETRRWSTDDWEILDYRVTWLGDDPSDLMPVYNNVILPRLQRVEGVGNVALEGIDEKALIVEVAQNRLNAHNLDIRTLNRAIGAGNVNVSAGYVEDASKRLAVRVVGEFEHVDQIRHLPVRPNIEMRDVAHVSYAYPPKQYFERFNGRDAISIEIQKTSTANLVATSDAVKAEMAAIQEELQGKLALQLVRDQAEGVKEAIRNLSQSALMGGFLAISIIFVFLRNFRSTLIIGMGIPISALCVFMIMYLMRQFFGATITLNMVSMMGLMVAIGMLVDPAVVALENIYRKRFDEGCDPETAAVEGSQEIAVPVLAAALTTICVFVPLVFMATGSGTSMWMRDFAITVCIAVIAAFCVAITLIPLATSRAFRNEASSFDRYAKIALGAVVAGLAGYQIYMAGVRESARWASGQIQWLIGGLSAVPTGGWVMFGLLVGTLVALYYRFRHIGLKGFYERLVRATLHYRWATLSGACVVLILGFYLYSKVEQQPYSWQPTRRIDYTVVTPRSYSLDDQLALFKSVEDILLPIKEDLDIEAVRTRVSSRWGSRISLYLVSAEAARLSTDDIKRQVMELFPKDLPGVEFREGSSRGGGTGVGVELRGRNQDVLAVLAEDIRLRMHDIPGIHSVETSLESGTEEIRVTVDRQRAQRYGVSPQQVASTIASALGTRGSSKFKTPDGEIDITVQLREEDRATLEQLRNTSFENVHGDLISLGNLADFELRKGPQSIERDNRQSRVEVFASTERSEVFRVGSEMSRRMEVFPLPQGYDWQMDRRFRNIASEQGELDFTLVLAVILIYMIMAALFESYIHPFTIMFSICFAFTGVALGLYAFQVPMDNNSIYGLLILFGIVVNNGIVLIDHINRYRRQGLSRRDAILKGGQDRLRPILMTAATTILGLLPLVIPMIYGTAEGYARRWGPIGLIIICGLSFSAVLTLVILPTIYSLMDDLARYAKRGAALAKIS